MPRPTAAPRIGIAIALLIGVLVTAALPPRRADAEQSVRLRNGMILRGSIVEIPSLNEAAFAAAAGPRSIWMIDDGLRRSYIYKPAMVAEVTEAPDMTQKIELWQPEPRAGKEIRGMGGILDVSPFNDFGRRMIIVRGPGGEPLSIVQGISEVTPRYTKIVGLDADPAYVWDMRIATSSIPADQLRSIFHRRLDLSSRNQRLNVVRFYYAAERFAEARVELQDAIDAFPDDELLSTQMVALVQLQAQQLLAEAQVRREAGQYQLATSMLENFPLDEVARETAIEARDALTQMRDQMKLATDLVQQLSQQVERLGGDQAAALQPILEEMRSGISLDTLARLSDYRRLGSEESFPLENRIALGLAGWMMGSGADLQNLAIARSLIHVRQLVAAYLRSTNDQQRAAILEQLAQLEGAQPDYVAKMLPLLPPPLPLPEPLAAATASPESDAAADVPSTAPAAPPGLYRITSPAAGEPAAEYLTAEYLVQLPPEYNPLRSYPCIVALHPPGGTPESQIDWWAGSYNAQMQMRMGQAARQGFVVVAPAWTHPQQSVYEYTSREHHRVLASLRDAMRRVSIHSDRVFLAGHNEGATAAWDIALAHPDIWAGLIAINGEADKYVKFYSDNAKGLPMYFVTGQIAGAPPPLNRNGPTWQRYMAANYNAMLVMYRGRGVESFYEEIHRLFDWMQWPIHRRGAPPQEIAVSTMRHGDQFFWWLEMPGITDVAAVNPILWDHTERLNAATVEAKVNADNSIRISQGPSDRFIVWLSPEMKIDLSQPVVVRARSRSTRYEFDNRVDVMLEDARTRADRHRPFWAKVQIP